MILVRPIKSRSFALLRMTLATPRSVNESLDKRHWCHSEPQAKNLLLFVKFILRGYVHNTAKEQIFGSLSKINSQLSPPFELK